MSRIPLAESWKIKGLRAVKGRRAAAPASRRASQGKRGREPSPTRFHPSTFPDIQKAFFRSRGAAGGNWGMMVCRSEGGPAKRHSVL
jgi:hypothetical protein